MQSNTKAKEVEGACCVLGRGLADVFCKGPDVHMLSAVSTQYL